MIPHCKIWVSVLKILAVGTWLKSARRIFSCECLMKINDRMKSRQMLMTDANKITICKEVNFMSVQRIRQHGPGQCSGHILAQLNAVLPCLGSDGVVLCGLHGAGLGLFQQMGGQLGCYIPSSFVLFPFWKTTTTITTNKTHTHTQTSPNICARITSLDRKTN